MKIIFDKAIVADASEILFLQKMAYVSEAEIYNDFTIEPLVQTLEGLKQQFKNHIILKAVLANKLIGSVRAYVENGISFIGKLIVHPEYRGMGIGKMLMQEIEKSCLTNRFELFTGSKSMNNIRLYEKLGYRIFKTKMIDDNLSLVYMEKVSGELSNIIYYNSLDVNELNKQYLIIKEKYEEYKNQNMKLDMSRGKPSPEQLELSMEMLDITSEDLIKAKDGSDCRNYGGVDGIPEAKELFSQILEVRTNEIIIGGNSSLNLMHDTITRAMIHGVSSSETPWGKLPVIKFLCPSPGYDRHFAICELLNIEMIVVDMQHNGPDMDMIEKLVSEDDSIKGIWCVPKYSNPDGITYSDETVDRLARMKTKAEDFRIFWDDAYTVHHLNEPDQLKNILAACKTEGNPDRVYMFSSTSKITFPGSGIAVIASSEKNINYMRKLISIQTIGPDKLNQLRHMRFLKNIDHVKSHMEKQAAIIKPKFDKVLIKLESELGGKDIATWNKPNGGYFISLNTLDGCAKDVVNMAAEAGVTLTKAGATFPYGKDPRNRNIRIAPTFPSTEELGAAIEVLCLCVQLVSMEKILSER